MKLSFLANEHKSGLVYVMSKKENTRYKDGRRKQNGLQTYLESYFAFHFFYKWSVMYAVPLLKLQG